MICGRHKWIILNVDYREAKEMPKDKLGFFEQDGESLHRVHGTSHIYLSCERCNDIKCVSVPGKFKSKDGQLKKLKTRATT